MNVNPTSIGNAIRDTGSSSRPEARVSIPLAKSIIARGGIFLKTYSGIMTPNAVPSNSPVPNVENRFIEDSMQTCESTHSKWM